MNGKMTVLPSPHAIQRAKERYNLDLTQEDIEYICKFCLAGNAGPPLLTKNIFGELKNYSVHTGRIYRMEYKGQIIEPVIKKTKGKNEVKCATINPPPTSDGRCYTSNKRREIERTLD